MLRRGRAELYREIPDELLVPTARDEEHLELLRSVGLRSAMLAPMTLRDRVLGVISFVSSESGRRFDEHDLALAENLALRAAAAVENARLYETASTIAQTLQTSLLPPGAAGAARRRARRRATARRAAASRSAATSTTCSAPPTTSGTWSSATSAARAPRPPP